MTEQIIEKANWDGHEMHEATSRIGFRDGVLYKMWMVKTYEQGKLIGMRQVWRRVQELPEGAEIVE